MLIILIPVVGFLVLLALAALAGTAGPNEYGPEPQEAVVAAA